MTGRAADVVSPVTAARRVSSSAPDDHAYLVELSAARLTSNDHGDALRTIMNI